MDDKWVDLELERKIDELQKKQNKILDDIIILSTKLDELSLRIVDIREILTSLRQPKQYELKLE